MTQEEKDLLLKDLCGRLQHGVKVDHFDVIKELLGVIPSSENVMVGYDINNYEDSVIEDIRPYLRPMNSMTEEEREYLSEELGFDENLENGELNDFGSYVYNRVNVLPLFDWLNKNMFDYRGLIPMCLALEAPEGMYK